ncbi:6-hydroxymethylpterin diphosphokinase MptE-like protein [Neobacillus drentensis]|uniref:6-hydroxymethylpterin diphosphokinase MptE-like protein n=1 Tax=Neobacillus drentensis TaxID=220684 RepID=UPI002862CB2B|nr:6-hydroxymethylpterin diphosphokinase MptE-like protein [Neobacillus drentensis]MDR7239964.1 hypothetical protein [Neobacillus drentensis]
MNIKIFLKKNKYTYYLIRQMRKIQNYFIPNTLFNIAKFLRVSGLYKKGPYEKLKNIKDKHKGERCFIVATGPSLAIEDLEKLTNEVTFGMNSICLAFDETDWRPTYYGIQDENVFGRLEKQIESLDVECKFISNTIPKKVNLNLTENCYLFPMNMLNHNIPHKKYNTKFSDDPFAAVYNGYSITYSLIQIAVYMGFEKIYLLGADCNYSKDMKHHFKEYGLVDPSFLEAGNMMISAYNVAKNYADTNNIKIFNATRGGMLEVFQRVDLDEVLTENKRAELLELKTM